MKKKGFTLIELLAVIIILAVIALIAMPIILGVIRNSRIGAIKDTAYGIIDAGKIYIAQNLKDGIKETTFVCKNNECISGSEKIQFKGSVDDGVVVIDEKGNVGVVVCNDNYCAKKEVPEKEVSVSLKEETKVITSATPSSGITDMEYKDNNLEISIVDNSIFDSVDITVEYEDNEIVCENNVCTLPTELNELHEYKVCVKASNGKEKCTDSSFYISATCADGYDLINGECKKTDSVDGELYYTCDSGYSLSGSKCSKTETTGKIPNTCTTLTGSCVQTCSGTGYTDGNHCPSYAPYMCFTQSSYSCPYCPSGYSDNGSNCIRTTTVDANINYRCADDYYVDGSTCKKDYVENANINIICPEGYTMKNNVCVK